MIVESALSNTYFEISDSSGKRRKCYVYHLKYRSKLTCLINGPVHHSCECKVLGDFGHKYAKDKPTTDHRQEDSTTNRRFGRHQ